MRSSAAVAIVLVAVGAGVTVVVLARDSEATPVLVDERAGILHGVRFGDAEQDVRARLGEETDDRDGFFPEGADYTGPPVVRAPRTDRGTSDPPAALHFGRTAFIVSPTAGVYAMATLERGAETRAGVGAGDDLDLVRERYDHAECGEAPAGEPLFGGEPPTYPWCRARVGDMRVFFGGDPIESITLIREAP